MVHVIIFREKNLKQKSNFISATENFTFKIENSRVVEKIIPEKISHNLRKSNNLQKIGKKR